VDLKRDRVAGLIERDKFNFLEQPVDNEIFVDGLFKEIHTHTP
jgi:hypothetical protein